MKKLKFIPFLLTGLLTFSMFSCSDGDDDKDPPASTEITVTYNVGNINPIMTAKITYTNAENVSVIEENVDLPWQKVITTDAPFTAKLKIEYQLISGSEIPDSIEMSESYSISCSGATIGQISSASTHTVLKGNLEAWIAARNEGEGYSKTFSIE